MMIVDAQIHLWQGLHSPPHHRGGPYLADEAIAAMDAAGIARAINCPAIWDGQANDYAAEAAGKYPDRIATMGWFPLDREPDAAFLDAFLARPGMRGLRFVIARPQDVAAFRGGSLDWIWSYADARALPIAFGLGKDLLPTVGNVARRFPAMRVAIDHLGVGPFEKLPSAMDHIDALCALAALPNVAVKASATPSMSTLPFPFVDIAPHLERVFQAFGAARMFWGTDVTRMTIPLQECVDQFTQHLPFLDASDLAQIMGRSLCDWLDWP